MARVLVLSTLNTKAEETDYFLSHLAQHGVQGEVIDLALDTGGKILDGNGKLAAMEQAVARAEASVEAELSDRVHAVVGLGGGTGGELALRVLSGLPITFPKVLITTLPFDPRFAAADSSVVLVPTLADICGLNATLREVLENAAALTAGLCQTRRLPGVCVDETSIGITALGATEGAVGPLVETLQGQGEECTVFHSNGFGGAAFARFAERGAFKAIVDLTPHELTRAHVGGIYVARENRYTAGGTLPRVVLPGALNFMGLGQRDQVSKDLLKRPHYAHTGFFTHIQLSESEMRRVTTELIKALLPNSGPTTLIVPMGGFSHQDGPGGAIESLKLREVFLDTARALLPNTITLEVLDDHISSPNVTSSIVAALDPVLAQRKVSHV